MELARSGFIIGGKPFGLGDLRIGKAFAANMGAMRRSRNNRSQMYHLITDFHSTAQRRIASLDLYGVGISAFMVLMVVETARFFFAR